MNRVARRVCVVFAVLVLLCTIGGFVAGNFFYNLALNPRADKTVVMKAPHNTIEIDDIKQEVWDDNAAWFDNSGRTEASIQSYDGLDLYAWVVRQPRPTSRWVLMAHGYGGNGRQLMGMGRKFSAMGYNLLMPDARGCGRSDGDYIGMGWHDRLDMMEWIDQIIAWDAGAEIVLYGISMGGGTVMMVSGEELPGNVKAIVEDCGYTSAWEEFSYQLKGVFGMPEFPLMHFADVVTRMRAGYSLQEANALEQVKKAAVPMLFIHGTEDTFVPYSMLDMVYEAAGSAEKEKLAIEGAGHAAAGSVAPELYWQTIEDFISRYVAA